MCSMYGDTLLDAVQSLVEAGLAPRVSALGSGLLKPLRLQYGPWHLTALWNPSQCRPRLPSTAADALPIWWIHHPVQGDEGITEWQIEMGERNVGWVQYTYRKGAVLLLSGLVFCRLQKLLPNDGCKMQIDQWWALFIFTGILYICHSIFILFRKNVVQKDKCSSQDMIRITFLKTS